MKTSPQQFEMLLTFMEQHGDISNPVKCARGRLKQLQLWEELRELLNSEGNGCIKSTEKWKKVWSDFKSNTKKKAGRLHRAAGGTGGGPANMTKLTDLEGRTLKVTGIEAATGLKVVEAGFSQEVQPLRTLQADLELAATESMASSADIADCNLDTENFERIEPEVAVQTISPPPVIDLYAERLDDNDQQDASGTTTAALRPSEPAMARQTTPRRRAARGRGGGTPRHRRVNRHLNAADQAAQHFLNSDAEWRQQLLQQHQNDVEIRREANRIRELEIDTQRMWQQIGNRAINILQKFVDKYCNHSDY